MKRANFQKLSPQEMEWMEAYVNGTIDSGTFEALQARMMESPGLRVAMRRYLTLDHHLRDKINVPVEAIAPWIEVDEGRMTPLANRHMPWIPVFWAAAATLVVLAAGVVFWLQDVKAGATTITAINGPVQWTSGDGRMQDDLEVGTQLSGGVLEALLPNSWVEFAFYDGSTITVSGQSVLTLSTGKQKQLHLRQGSLSARVTRQPDGYPLLVNTPTAELQVLGTQLNVEAAPASTRLLVNEGAVRLKRLVDGSTAQVPAGFEATAAVDSREDLGVRRLSPTQPWWKSTLPEDAVQGVWISDMDELAKQLKGAVKRGELSDVEGLAKYKQAAILNKTQGRLRAVPMLMGKSKTPGAPTKAHLIVLSVSRDRTHPVRLVPSAVVLVLGRVRSDADVLFGLTTRHPQGGFAGKYAATRRIPASTDETASFRIELPLEEFHAMDKTFAASPIESELAEWWCFTKSDDADLEIMQVEVSAP